MALQPRYSSILADILKKKHNNCICPTSFLASLKTDKFENTGCQFGPGCQFEPHGQFFTDCKHNKAKCTCYQQCTCGAEARMSLSAAYEGIGLFQSEDTIKHGTKQLSHCDTANCICEGVCDCKSEESLEPSTVQPPSHCNKTNCICSVCLCQNQARFLPTYFRDTVKREASSMMADEVLREQCAEIKQLLCEYKESTNNELEKHKPKATLERNVSKVVSISDGQAQKKPSIFKLIDGQQISVNGVCLDKKSVEHTSKKHSSRSSTKAVKRSSKQSSKKYDKAHKKEKTFKHKHMRTAGSNKTKSTIQSSLLSSVKLKPPRMKYYYSGSTKHYGVKLGHKHCVEKPMLVPKNMGWLWNFEHRKSSNEKDSDRSKGIRERKGWPPGFIGKSIKNMIKVMKQFEQSENSGQMDEEKRIARWKTINEKISEMQEPREEPPLLHIHKKGKTYNITFCPKNSDDDIGPIPIPFTITEKKRDSDTETSDSSLEFELHSPKPHPYLIRKPPVPQEEPQKQDTKYEETTTKTAPQSQLSTSKQKKKVGKRRSKGSEENKIVWEEQPTQIQNIHDKQSTDFI